MRAENIKLVWVGVDVEFPEFPLTVDHLNVDQVVGQTSLRPHEALVIKITKAEVMVT